MNQHQFESRHEEEQAQRLEAAPGIEFASPEELLRFDAARTPVPPLVAHRLAQQLPVTPPAPWWRRWLGS